MVHAHLSTPAQRAQWTAMLLAHPGEYGLVTRLSREAGVSRPTLYAWRAQAAQALHQTFSAPAPPPETVAPTVLLERQVLTLLVQAHATQRGIQTCLRQLLQQGHSMPTITAILHAAQQRALTWMASHAPATPRALALDELYANNRTGAYLHVVDVHSGAVWAAEGPLAADTDSWILVLWSLQDRGLVWDRLVGDHGAALHAGAQAVTPDVPFQRDVWHELDRCAHVQARLDRAVTTLTARTPAVARQAARVAAGQPARGRNAQTDLTVHQTNLRHAQRVADDVRFLTQELRRLWDVVVIDQRGVLDAAQRQTDLACALALLAEVAQTAPAAQQHEIHGLHKTLTAALPELLTFVAQVAQVQADLQPVLPAHQQALLGWAWLRRKLLGWTSAAILAAVPAAWWAAGRILLHSWDDAVRVSSSVERWHSILRPHVAVHRTLTSGMLALLAVWHNHRVFTRGVNKGKSPLHLSGMHDAPTDWLVALGYPPAAAPMPLAQPGAADMAHAA
jgi:transposase-like protein